MSITIGTYTTAHLGSATGPYGQPLPLRERTFGAGAGHCACAMDWAVLNEMMAERFFNDGDRSLDAYHNVSDDSAAGEIAFASFVEYSLGSAAGRFLDPSWTPQDLAGNGWAFYGNPDGVPPVGSVLHGFKRASRPLVLNNAAGSEDKHVGVLGHRYTTPRTPRALDDMRRMFHDARMLHRIATQCTVSYSSTSVITYERYPGGGEYGSYPGTVTLGSDVLSVARRVRETSGFGVRNNGAAWAMVEMWCAKDAPQIYGPENLKRTLAVPCVLGGVLDTSRFNPQALKAWTQSVLGSFADGHDYYAQARIAGVYADINFPADYFFNGWEWEPQQGD